MYCVEYLTFIVKLWNIQSLEKHQEAILSTLPSWLCDAQGTVRAASRALYWSLQARFPRAAKDLLETLDATTQRNIFEDSHSNGSSQTMSSSSRQYEPVQHNMPPPQPTIVKKNPFVLPRKKPSRSFEPAEEDIPIQDLSNQSKVNIQGATRVVRRKPINEDTVAKKEALALRVLREERAAPSSIETNALSASRSTRSYTTHGDTENATRAPEKTRVPTEPTATSSSRPTIASRVPASESSRSASHKDEEMEIDVQPTHQDYKRIIGDLLLSCNDSLWSKRMNSFAELGKLIAHSKCQNEIRHFSSRIVKTFEAHLMDAHYRVSHVVLQFLGHVITAMPSSVQARLQWILPKVL